MPCPVPSSCTSSSKSARFRRCRCRASGQPRNCTASAVCQGSAEPMRPTKVCHQELQSWHRHRTACSFCTSFCRFQTTKVVRPCPQAPSPWGTPCFQGLLCPDEALGVLRVVSGRKKPRPIQTTLSETLSPKPCNGRTPQNKPSPGAQTEARTGPMRLCPRSRCC